MKTQQNEDITEGRWRQFTGEVKKQWGKLNDDDIEKLKGHTEKFVGVLQEKYGYLKSKAQEEWDAFMKKFKSDETQPPQC